MAASSRSIEMAAVVDVRTTPCIQESKRSKKPGAKAHFLSILTAGRKARSTPSLRSVAQGKLCSTLYASSPNAFRRLDFGFRQRAGNLAAEAQIGNHLLRIEDR